MAPSRKKPGIVLSKVPSVKELCDRLGFQSREASIFTDTTHAFRKSYTTTSGESGVDLTEWNDASVQLELLAMAIKYLDEDGHGLRFWSNSRSCMEEGDFKYPEDKTLIADLLKQLFWKQNKYALNNQTYNDRKAGEPRNPLLDDFTLLGDGTQNSAVNKRLLNSKKRRHTPPSSNPSNIQSRDAPLEDDPTSTEALSRDDIYDVPVDRNYHGQTTISYTAQPFRQSPKQNTNKRKTIEGPSPNALNRAKGGISLNMTSDGPSPKRIKNQRRPKHKQTENQDQPRRSSGRRREQINYRVPDVDDIYGDDFADNIFDEYQDDPPSSLHEEVGQRNTLRQSQTPIADWLSEQRTSNSPRSRESITITSATMNTTVRGDRRSTIEESQEIHSFIAPLPPMSVNLTSMPSNASPGPHYKFAPSDRPAVDLETLTNKSILLPSVQKINEKAVSASYFPTTPLSPTSPSTIRHPSEPPYKPRSNSRGSFWIVRSSEPYDAISWSDGGIKNKSLATVMGEISTKIERDGISQLKIRLKTALSQITTTIERGAEDHWEFAKMDLEKLIREAFRRDMNAGNHYRIWIEPLFEIAGIPSNGIQGDDEEIDF